MKNIIFIAPPGGGKGTQSEMLASEFGYEHISSSILLRKIAKEDTPFGRDMKERLSTGEFISDEIVDKLIREALEKIGNRKFILDGYPRKLHQAYNLETIFDELNITDIIAIYLNIEKEVAIQRILTRITCCECGASYSRDNDALKPKQEGICDKCRSPLEKRDDDTVETLEIRFENYQEKTAPILDFYRYQGILREVKAEEEAKDTYKNLKLILEE